MKKMVYGRKRNREVLDRGIYEGYEYFVISLGTHPCAYVKLHNENPEVAKYNIGCHGGITYCEDYLILPDGKIEGNIIGWDYAHYGDYLGFDELFTGMTYTTEEMIADCRSVIRQLVEGRSE